MITTDVLIVGSGVAGLSFAIRMAEERPNASITIITKSDRDHNNTAYAQGGIATVTDFDTDSFEKHIKDTLIAGDGLCDEAVVDIVVKEGRERVDDIIKWGVNFDKEENGEYDLGMEGGHSEHRILHYKDVTGAEIQRTLVEKAKTYKNIKLIEYYFVVDLITQHHLGRTVTRLTKDLKCFGVYALDLKNGDMERIIAKVVMLATGGIGQLYQNTTNPKVATGDGIAMVYRAKGHIANMEFVQFHPTGLFNPGESPNFLISEAVRGEGAILRNSSGEAFMPKYDERKDLAPRDIVARAIDNEMKTRGEDHMFLDCTHMNMEEFGHHFPNIKEKCSSLGIDVSKDLIPVVPAAHYMCGGVSTDELGKTSIQNLWAAGECAATGLHGANRLASNSLLQGMVFGHRAAIDAAKRLDDIAIETNVPMWNAEGTTEPKEMVLITQSHKELMDAMGTYVGIVRTNVRLQRANKRLDLLYKETEELYLSTVLSPQLLELRNLITIGHLITKSALYRKESRGLHYNLDYPDKNRWVEDTLI